MSPESRGPPDHPLRRIKRLVDSALKDLSPLFDEMYAEVGRPSIPPERLLKAKVLQALYTVRSEILLVEALHYNLLFRWFLDLNLTESIWDHSTSSKNQQRLLQHQVGELFFARIVALAREQGWASDEHFSVDGSLIDAWASLKSFQPKDAPRDPTDGDPSNPSVDFHGQKRGNATHQSTTDPEAKLARKGRGKEARLSFDCRVASKGEQRASKGGHLRPRGPEGGRSVAEADERPTGPRRRSSDPFLAAMLAAVKNIISRSPAASVFR